MPANVQNPAFGVPGDELVNPNPRCATFGRVVKGNFPEAMDGRAARSGSVDRIQ